MLYLNAIPARQFMEILRTVTGWIDGVFFIENELQFPGRNTFLSADK